jgi:N,N'-diacetyllegionaminate synthase
MRDSVLIIAEAGVNHNGDIELAKKLIEVAAQAGADFVKFQTFQTENLVSKAAQMADYQQKNLQNQGASQFEMLKKLELDLNMHLILIEHANKNGIKFLSTAFDLDSIDLLVDLKMPFFKIPSGEITNKPYLQKIARTKLPVIISTGMADLIDIENAVNVFKAVNYSSEDLSILHCNTEYPTPMGDVNLNAMNTIKEKFDLEIGYSDHTLGVEVSIAAVAMGARIIEKHFTLDKNMIGPDHKASLNPEELALMVRSIRNIEKAFGDGIKTPSDSETKNMMAARKSIHISEDLQKGHVIALIDLDMKRPSSGISPMEYEKVIGNTLAVDKLGESPLKWEDIN